MGDQRPAAVSTLVNNYFILSEGWCIIKGFLFLSRGGPKLNKTLQASDWTKRECNASLQATASTDKAFFILNVLISLVPVRNQYLLLMRIWSTNKVD